MKYPFHDKEPENFYRKLRKSIDTPFRSVKKKYVEHNIHQLEKNNIFKN